ncbi:MAG: hypothetical protein WB686_13335 [Pseudolabrys sp.]
MSALPPTPEMPGAPRHFRDVPKAAILVGEAEQRRAAPEDALWMDAPDFAVAQAGLRIQSSI